MFKNLLVAVDDSPHAKAAVDYAAYLAAELGARMELLHVIDWRLLAGHFITHSTRCFAAKTVKASASASSSTTSDMASASLSRLASARLISGQRCRRKDRDRQRRQHIIERARTGRFAGDRSAGRDRRRWPRFTGRRDSTSRPYDQYRSAGRAARRCASFAAPCWPAMQRGSPPLWNRWLVSGAFGLEVDVVHLIEPGKDVTDFRQTSEYLEHHSIAFWRHTI